jgi:hypothetical protein
MGLLRPDKSGLAMTNGERNKLYFSEQSRVSEWKVDFTVAEKNPIHMAACAWRTIVGTITTS